MAMTKEQWDMQQNASKKKYKYIPTGKPGEVKMVEDNEEDEKDGDGEESTTKITDQHKQDWNKYLGWLKDKGMQGKPELDKGGLGERLFDQYIKENPETSLNRNLIPGIRREYNDLRNQAIEEFKSGKSVFNYKDKPSSDYDLFMKHIVDNEKSANPNYVGQHLTMTMFPGAKITEKDANTGKVLSQKSIPVMSTQSKNEFFKKS